VVLERSSKSKGLPLSKTPFDVTMSEGPRKLSKHDIFYIARPEVFKTLESGDKILIQ